MTLAELKTLIQNYTENEETTFVSTLNDFIISAEDRLFQFPLSFDQDSYEGDKHSVLLRENIAHTSSSEMQNAVVYCGDYLSCPRQYGENSHSENNTDSVRVGEEYSVIFKKQTLGLGSVPERGGRLSRRHQQQVGRGPTRQRA